MGNAEEKEKAKNRFIPNAIAVHGDLYDYSKVRYNGTDAKVVIICKVHGEFLKSPYNHIMNKEGCQKCAVERTRLNNLKKRKLVVEKYESSSHKKCSKCGKHKIKDEFHVAKGSLSGLSSQCKECNSDHSKCLSGVTKIKPLKMYRYYKLCCKCKACKSVDDFSINNSRADGLGSMCKCCERNYRKDKSSHIREYRQEYYMENKVEISLKVAEHRYKLASYDSYAENLTVQESPLNIDGMLFVKCKNCGILFQPTNAAVLGRIHCLKNFGIGESHLYCSDGCKESCDVFKAISKRKSERGADKVSRSCQTYIKKELQRLQCDNEGATYCEKCGDVLDSEIHHTNMVKDKKDVNNAAGMMLLCFRCHRELHSQCV